MSNEIVDLLKIDVEEYKINIDIPSKEGIFYFMADGDVAKYRELKGVSYKELMRGVYMKKVKTLNDLLIKKAQLKRDTK